MHSITLRKEHLIAFPEASALIRTAICAMKLKVSHYRIEFLIMAWYWVAHSATNVPRFMQTIEVVNWTAEHSQGRQGLDIYALEMKESQWHMIDIAI
jgi:hypothetical protein